MRSCNPPPPAKSFCVASEARVADYPGTELQGCPTVHHVAWLLCRASTLRPPRMFERPPAVRTRTRRARHGRPAAPPVRHHANLPVECDLPVPRPVEGKGGPLEELQHRASSPVLLLVHEALLVAEGSW